jgi:hypothetical protein
MTSEEFLFSIMMTMMWGVAAGVVEGRVGVATTGCVDPGGDGRRGSWTTPVGDVLEGGLVLGGMVAVGFVARGSARRARSRGVTVAAWGSA